MISTRGRYALRALIDLALNAKDGFIPIKDVAARQEISFKYLERIMPVLARHKIVEVASGHGGGYRLAIPPEKCHVGDVLRLTEGTLAPVACLEGKYQECPRSHDCMTLPMWEKFNKITNDFFDSITIADLLI